MADIFVLKMHENYLIFNVFLHEYTYLKAGIFNIQYLMVCVFEDEYRAGGLRVEQLRINAYSYQAVFQETIEKKIPSTPLSGGAKSTIEIYGNRHQDRDKEEPKDNGEDGMLTRPNCA